MPKKKTSSMGAFDKVKIRRKGVHAKTKTSKGKKSKHYKKSYRGQGR